MAMRQCGAMTACICTEPCTPLRATKLQWPCLTGCGSIKSATRCCTCLGCGQPERGPSGSALRPPRMLSRGPLPPWIGEPASCQCFHRVWLVQAGPSSSAAQQVLPDGPEPVVFEVEYTPTEQLEPLEDAEAQSKVRSLGRLSTVGQPEVLYGLQNPTPALG